MRRLYYGWIVCVAAALVLFGGSGARFSFGVFLKPMTEEFHWERGALSLAASITLLLGGLLRPLTGLLVDRYGSRAVLALSLALSAAGLVGVSFLTELWHAYFLYGFLAVGYVGASPVTTAKLVSEWFVRRRGLAMSVASAGSALGELTIVPLAMFVLLNSNWQTAYRVLAAMVALIILPVALLAVRNRPQEMGLAPDGGTSGDTFGTSGNQEHGINLGQALGSLSFWQMAFGFFVCGYTMSFANTHFVPFATDMGIEDMTAAGALGLVGAFSIGGTLILGALSDRYRRKYLLSAVYLLRGMSSLVLLQVAGSPSILYLGSFVLGISWTATTPLTSAIAADLYGLKNLGVIFGTMWMAMVIGSSSGAVIDGVIFDHQHSYGTALLLNIVAGLAASLVIATIRDRPITPARAVQGRAATAP